MGSMMRDGRKAETAGSVRPRAFIRQLLPGVVLPGTIYFICVQWLPVLVALAVASSVPLLDVIIRLMQRKAPSPIGLAFVAFAALSVGLALGLRSPAFILAKGAVFSAVLGIAFGISAMIRRPLCRTIAIVLAAEHALARGFLAERWRHPRAVTIFTTLSVGWAVLLLLSAIQQGFMVLTVSPGTVMAAEPAVQATFTIVGTAVSILYVRRSQQGHPELGILPSRSR
jgi:hypothetical protein